MKTFESGISFNSQRIQAAAVYCSDGRLGEQFDELLHVELQLPRYDRLAVPGGAACLASHFAVYREEEGVMAQLRFLVTAHDLARVVLIAHQDCGFYQERLKVSPLQVETQQKTDIAKAVRRVRSIDRNLNVDAWFARRKTGGRIVFEEVDV